MPTPTIAIFVAVFAIATLRDVVAGFLISILVLIAGVTYFFGIAQGNGTIDRVVHTLLASVAVACSSVSPNMRRPCDASPRGG